MTKFWRKIWRPKIKYFRKFCPKSSLPRITENYSRFRSLIEEMIGRRKWVKAVHRNQFSAACGWRTKFAAIVVIFNDRELSSWRLSRDVAAAEELDWKRSMKYWLNKVKLCIKWERLKLVSRFNQSKRRIKAFQFLCFSFRCFLLPIF